MECLFYIIFSLHLCKILASSEASERLSGVFYDHIDDDHRLTDADEELLSGEKTTHIPEIFDIN